MVLRLMLNSDWVIGIGSCLHFCFVFVLLIYFIYIVQFLYMPWTFIMIICNIWQFGTVVLSFLIIFGSTVIPFHFERSRSYRENVKNVLNRTAIRFTHVGIRLPTRLKYNFWRCSLHAQSLGDTLLRLIVGVTPSIRVGILALWSFDFRLTAIIHERVKHGAKIYWRKALSKRNFTFSEEIFRPKRFLETVSLSTLFDLNSPRSSADEQRCPWKPSLISVSFLFFIF